MRCLLCLISELYTFEMFAFLNVLSIVFNPNRFYKIFIFVGSPYDWPGTVVRELGQVCYKENQQNEKVL